MIVASVEPDLFPPAIGIPLAAILWILVIIIEVRIYRKARK